MKINEFITEQVNIRAKAALELTEALNINGITIHSGCDKDGIEVSEGIEELAAIVDAELSVTQHECSFDPTRITIIKEFWVYGSRFYFKDHPKKGASADAH